MWKWDSTATPTLTNNGLFPPPLLGSSLCHREVLCPECPRGGGGPPVCAPQPYAAWLCIPGTWCGVLSPTPCLAPLPWLSFLSVALPCQDVWWSGLEGKKKEPGNECGGEGGGLCPALLPTHTPRTPIPPTAAGFVIPPSPAAAPALSVYTAACAVGIAEPCVSVCAALAVAPNNSSMGGTEGGLPSLMAAGISL